MSEKTAIFIHMKDTKQWFSRAKWGTTKFNTNNRISIWIKTVLNVVNSIRGIVFRCRVSMCVVSEWVSVIIIMILMMNKTRTLTDFSFSPLILFLFFSPSNPESNYVNNVKDVHDRQQRHPWYKKWWSNRRPKPSTNKRFIQIEVPLWIYTRHTCTNTHTHRHSNVANLKAYATINTCNFYYSRLSTLPTVKLPLGCLRCAHLLTSSSPLRFTSYRNLFIFWFQLHKNAYTPISVLLLHLFIARWRTIVYHQNELNEAAMNQGKSAWDWKRMEE